MILRLQTAPFVVLVSLIFALLWHGSWSAGSGPHWLLSVPAWMGGAWLLRRRFERTSGSLWAVWGIPAAFALPMALYENSVVQFFGPVLTSWSLLAALIYSWIPQGTLDDLGSMGRRSLWAACRGLIGWWEPLSQLSNDPQGNPRIQLRLLLRIGFGALVSGFFALLFCLADSEFLGRLTSLFDGALHLDLWSVFQVSLAFLAILGCLWKILFQGWEASAEPEAGETCLWVGRGEWSWALGMSAGVFALFLSSQMERMFYRSVEPERIAQYAHEGFGELWFVTLVVFSLSSTLYRRFWAPRQDGAPALGALGSALSVLILLSMAVAGSAFHRLALYDQLFGLSVLRIYAILGVASLVLLQLMLLGALWFRPTVLRFNAMITLAGCLVLAGTGLVNVEAWALRSHWTWANNPTKELQVDVDYFGSCSRDILPTLARLRQQQPEDGALRSIEKRVLEGANASRFR